MSQMHDWVLYSIECDWKAAKVTIVFDTYRAGMVSLIADGVTDVHIPQTRPWGRSIHVNEVREARGGAGTERKLEIEMQSGDVITVAARSFTYPDATSNDAAPATAETAGK